MIFVTIFSNQRKFSEIFKIPENSSKWGLENTMVFGLKWYFKVELSSSSSEDDLERKRNQARNFARFEAIAKRRGKLLVRLRPILSELSSFSCEKMHYEGMILVRGSPRDLFH